MPSNKNIVLLESPSVAKGILLNIEKSYDETQLEPLLSLFSNSDLKKIHESSNNDDEFIIKVEKSLDGKVEKIISDLNKTSLRLLEKLDNEVFKQDFKIDPESKLLFKDEILKLKNKVDNFNIQEIYKRIKEANLNTRSMRNIRKYFTEKKHLDTLDPSSLQILLKRAGLLNMASEIHAKSISILLLGKENNDLGEFKRILSSMISEEFKIDFENEEEEEIVALSGSLRDEEEHNKKLMLELEEKKEFIDLIPLKEAESTRLNLTIRELDKEIERGESLFNDEGDFLERLEKESLELKNNIRDVGSIVDDSNKIISEKKDALESLTRNLSMKKNEIVASKSRVEKYRSFINESKVKRSEALERLDLNSRLLAKLNKVKDSGLEAIEEALYKSDKLIESIINRRNEVRKKVNDIHENIKISILDKLHREKLTRGKAVLERLKISVSKTRILEESVLKLKEEVIKLKEDPADNDPRLIEIKINLKNEEIENKLKNIDESNAVSKGLREDIKALNINNYVTEYEELSNQIKSFDNEHKTIIIKDREAVEDFNKSIRRKDAIIETGVFGIFLYRVSQLIVGVITGIYSLIYRIIHTIASYILEAMLLVSRIFIYMFDRLFYSR